MGVIQLDAIQAELDQKADYIKRQAYDLYAAPVEVRPCFPVGKALVLNRCS